MQTTFINQNNEGTILEAGEKALISRSEDFDFFAKYETDSEESFFESVTEEAADLDELETAIAKYRDVGSFNDYGLDFSLVEAGTFDDQKESYYRYQLSYGGPSEEIRFYRDGTIVFVYLDWFSGVGFDVTGEDWAEWLKDFFTDIQSIDWDNVTDYYEEEE